MNVLIVGQPIKNKGDYAACKALICLLSQRGINVKVLFTFDRCSRDKQFDSIEGLESCFFKLPRGFRLWGMLSLLLPIFMRALINLPSFQKYKKLLMNTDFVLFSPGGLEIGLYRSWKSLWLLYSCLSLRKDYGLYSRSIGGFRKKTLLDYFFYKKSKKCLEVSKFNGLRDVSSYRWAERLGVQYFPSIDVVYSFSRPLPIPEETQSLIGDSYVVFSPSQFHWHPRMNKNSDLSYQISYERIMKMLLSKIEGNIVMIPHIYGQAVDKENDINYFNIIKDNIMSDRIIVIDDGYDTDIYQNIINGASCVISARYHHAIFSINNNTPFIAMSYEDKTPKMLNLLGLEHYSFDLYQAVEDGMSERYLDMISDILQKDASSLKIEIENAKNKAYLIADSSFEELYKILESNNGNFKQ